MSERDVQIHDVMSVKTGAKHPRKLQREQTNPFHLRGWQQEAHDRLSNKRLRRLLAPTGAGKSIAMEALALTDMRRGYKCIVAVPMTDIMHGFAKPKDVLVGGEVLRWEPTTVERSYVPGGYASTTGTMIEWLRSSEKTAVVCTHSTLRLVYFALVDTNEQQLLKKISLFIDEGHHLQDDRDESEEQERNKLSELVHAFINTKTARVLVTTATWLRRNRKPVVADLSKFTTYHLGVLRYLEEVAKIEMIHFRYMIGTGLDCFAKLIDEDKKRPTIVYMRAGQKRSAKIAQYGGVAAMASRARLVHLDLVNDGPSRLLREREFYASGQESTDVVIALSKANEGSDWARCSRELFMAPRGSIPQMLQMIGRALRRYAGKREVEINIAIPPNVPVEKLRDYLKVLCATLVLAYQFKTPQLRPEKPKAASDSVADRVQRDKGVAVNNAILAAHELMADPDFAAQVAPQLIDFVVSESDAVTIDRALQRQARDFPVLKDPNVRVALLQVIAGSTEATTRALSVIGTADDIDMNISLEESVLGKLRAFSAKLGHRDLGRIKVTTLVEDPELARELAEEARQWCKVNGIRGLASWRTARKPQHFPVMPWRWLGIPFAEFFGNRAHISRFAMTDEARETLLAEVRSWVNERGIVNGAMWDVIGRERPPYFPSQPWVLAGESQREFFGGKNNFLKASMEERFALADETRKWAASVGINDGKTFKSRAKERPEHLPSEPWRLTGQPIGEFFGTRTHVMRRNVPEQEQREYVIRVARLARAADVKRWKQWARFKDENRGEIPAEPWKWIGLTGPEFMKLLRSGESLAVLELPPRELKREIAKIRDDNRSPYGRYRD